MWLHNFLIQALSAVKLKGLPQFARCVLMLLSQRVCASITKRFNSHCEVCSSSHLGGPNLFCRVRQAATNAVGKLSCFLLSSIDNFTDIKAKNLKYNIKHGATNTIKK